MKKKIFIFLVSLVFLCIFSMGIVNAEEKEVLTETQKELIKNTVFVHNVSVNKKHIVINNFPESSLSPIIFMATWIFDVDSIIENKTGKVTYIYINIYNPDRSKNPKFIFIVVVPMIWEKGPYKGQIGRALIGYNYIIDGIEYNYVFKRTKYVRVPGDFQQTH